MIRFEKYHGTGNDFVLIDATERVPDRRALARELCDREHGVAQRTADGPGTTDSVGADGVLFLALEERYSPPRVVMTLVQPDGSTAAMCGNGARCAAAWAVDRTGSRQVMVDTQAGTRRAEVDAGTAAGGADDGVDVTIGMGSPRFDPRSVPLAADIAEPLVAEPVAGLTVTAVDTGVPHAVAFVADVSTTDLEAVAPAVRHAPVFPDGANVTIASRRSGGGFDQRTYERGVEDETRSCGTGAVAVAAVARERGLVTDDAVAVHPPGGRLEVSFSATGASLSGPVVREFDGETPAVTPRAIDIADD
jgi:diaminopimelate epimerase